MSRSALIVGVTGLVGSHLFEILQRDPDYSEIIVITRKPVISNSEKVVQHCINFDHLKDHKEKFKADDVYCCLGSTMKKAGSKEAFFKVDYSYITELAQISFENNATSFNLISALGANKNSLFFYNKVKGQTEEAVINLKFKTTNIVRPSLILGERKEIRTAEHLAQMIGKKFSFLFSGPFKKYTPVNAEDIAKSLWKLAKSGKPGVHIIESSELVKIATS